MEETQLVFFMCAWMIVIVLAIWGIWFVLHRRKQQIIAKAMRDWPTTKGFVHFSRVEIKTDNDTGSAYVIGVYYVYLVDGKSYERKFETERFAREKDAVKELPLYTRGKEVIVYYNPKKPKDSHCDLEAITYGVVL